MARIKKSPKLTAKRRKGLGPKQFAGPNRTFPIDTRGRASNALARASQFRSGKALRSIQKKVCRKFPGFPVCAKLRKQGNDPF